MPNGASIPPWLNINPLAPVPGFLQGFSTGASAGASRRAAEQRAAEFAQEQAFRESQAQEANAIRRQALELDTTQFQENLRIKQEAAEREARTAADQLEGMQGFERDLPQLGYEKSLTKWAHKLFASKPGEMVDLARTQRIMAEPELRDIGGQKFALNRVTGALIPIQPSEFTPANLAPGTYTRGSRVVTVPQPTMSKADQLKHKRLSDELNNLPISKKNELQRQKLQQQLEELESKVTLPGTTEGTPSPIPVSKAVRWRYNPSTRQLELIE